MRAYNTYKKVEQLLVFGGIKKIRKYFRGDAAFSKPEIHEYPEKTVICMPFGCFQTIFSMRKFDTC